MILLKFLGNISLGQVLNLTDNINFVILFCDTTYVILLFRLKYFKCVAAFLTPQMYICNMPEKRLSISDQEYFY